MSHPRRVRKAVSLVVACGAGVWLCSVAMGYPHFLDAWQQVYPGSTLPQRMNVNVGADCYVCHQPPQFNDRGTCYREDLVARLVAGRTIEEAIADIDGWDSDGDGVANGAEITRPRADRDIGYHPGLVGPSGMDMCATPPKVVTNTLETPPPLCGSADFDGDGDLGTDTDIESFFACLAGSCCASCGSADFNGDGDIGTDSDIESFFRVLAGGNC